MTDTLPPPGSAPPGSPPHSTADTPRRPGRPRTTGRGHAGARVTVRLSDDEVSALRYAAEAWEVSVPELLRRLVIDHLSLPLCADCGRPVSRRREGLCSACWDERPPEDDVGF